MSSQLEQTWLPLCRLVAYRAGLTFPRWPLDAAAVAAASDGTTRLRAGAPDHPRRHQSPEGSIFDRNCSQITKTEPKREWVQEVINRRGEFQALWDRDGPRYLSAVLNEVRLPFPYRAMQATLTACPAVGSMSDPLFVAVREFLSDASNSPPVSMLRSTCSTN
jgi:hypothetical protein